MATNSKSSLRSKAAKWDAEVTRIKSQLESSWHENEFKLESLWHESAIATLRWISGHRSRIDGLRQAVRGTSVEKVLDTALSVLRSEAKAPAPRRRKAGSLKAAVKAPAKRAKAARKTASRAAR